MERQQLMDKLCQLYEVCPGNTVMIEPADKNIPVEAALFEQPLVGIGASEDGLFEQFKTPGVIGPWYSTPKEWLPAAKTVVSLFFPYSDALKQCSRAHPDGPSPIWMLGRKQGRRYIVEFIQLLTQWLEAHGCSTCVPVLDTRFERVIAGNNFSDFEEVDCHTFGSNWSERHAAYVCGLGTFGLSRCLITEKGASGQIISLITDRFLEPTPRPYSGIYDYCTQCGACARRCPSHAISPEHGKDLNICNAWIRSIPERYSPEHECGCCQSIVPCESVNPSKFTRREQ